MPPMMPPPEQRGMAALGAQAGPAAEQQDMAAHEAGHAGIPFPNADAQVHSPPTSDSEDEDDGLPSWQHDWMRHLSYLYFVQTEMHFQELDVALTLMHGRL